VNIFRDGDMFILLS